ncbi:MAG: glycosyltransferase family 2 protein, partial [Bacteroidales bacterium]|nr:glycosyltransferase family 2 protein [Bacteroidales bacterium]
MAYDYKVSVIIPVYNTEQYIRQTLISACNQTLRDIEIICINDGSTDNSEDIIRECAKNDPR